MASKARLGFNKNHHFFSPVWSTKKDPLGFFVSNQKNVPRFFETKRGGDTRVFVSVSCYLLGVFTVKISKDTWDHFKIPDCDSGPPKGSMEQVHWVQNVPCFSVTISGWKTRGMERGKTVEVNFVVVFVGGCS